MDKDLFRNFTNTGKTLSANSQTVLKEYLRNAMPPKDFARGSRNISRDILVSSMSALFPQRHQAIKEDVLRNFIDNPVMQLADGSTLLYDPETFLTNYCFQLACVETDTPFILGQQCSRSKMIMNKKMHLGSAYLHIGERLFSVFNLSNRLMSRSSAATVTGPAQINFQSLETDAEPNVAVADIPDILNDLNGREFPSVSDAFLEANHYIWSELPIPNKRPLIQFDERLNQEIVARHMEDTRSPIYKMLFDSEVRQAYLRNRDIVVESDQNIILKSTTDFFYYNVVEKADELKPIRISSTDGKAIFVRETSGEEIPIDFTPQSIAIALREGRLFPDLTLSYTARSILPGVISFGGASQHEYLPQIARILYLTAQDTDVLKDNPLSEEILHDHYAGSRMIAGSGLIELDTDLKRALGSMNRSTDFAALNKKYVNQPLQETMGSMSYYDYFGIFLDR